MKVAKTTESETIQRFTCGTASVIPIPQEQNLHNIEAKYKTPRIPRLSQVYLALDAQYLPSAIFHFPISIYIALVGLKWEMGNGKWQMKNDRGDFSGYPRLLQSPDESRRHCNRRGACGL
jgi:hypothetical protein